MDNYRITLDYKAVFMPYYGNGGLLYPGHHGIDIVPANKPASNYPVKLSDGTLLGYMGNTGAVTGIHTHVDKSIDGSRNYSSYRSPKDWFTISGEVIFAANAGTAGNMVKIKADNGHIYRFLHFNKINVRVGQRVGRTVGKLDLNAARILAHGILGRLGAHSGSSDEDLKKHHVGSDALAKIYELFSSREGKKWREQTLPKLLADSRRLKPLEDNVATLKLAVEDLQKVNSQLSARPTKAELEEALRKNSELGVELQEKIEEIERLQAEEPDEQEVVTGFVKRLLNKLKEFIGWN